MTNANGHNLDPIHFNTQHINQGGVSSSNTKSRITVPTAGTYLIQGFLSGSLTTASAGDGIQIKIKIMKSASIDMNFTFISFILLRLLLRLFLNWQHRMVVFRFQLSTQ